MQADSLLSEPPGKPNSLVIMNIIMNNEYLVPILWASQVVLVAKNPPANAEDIRDAGLIPGSRRSTGGGHGNSLQVFLPGESHRQRSLEGYSPWGCKESDMTEATLACMHPYYGF